MKALVTGVAGFIGSHIAERLIREGYEVYGIDDLSAGYRENLHPRVKFFEADVSNKVMMNYFFQDHKFDVFFHNAASKKQVCMKDPHRDLEVNAGGTLCLLQHALDQGARFIHASTGSVYGESMAPTQREDHVVRPVSYYGVSKLAGEKYVQMYHDQFGLETTILRYSSVYGSRQEDKAFGGVVAIFKKALAEGKPLTVFGTGTQSRGFTHVADVVEANLVCAQNDRAIGEVYNCASGGLNSINDLIAMLLSGDTAQIIYKDRQIGDIDVFSVDNSKIVRDFGIMFKTLKEGLWL
jgi:UDP-glucose 4-epimerase